MNTLQNIYDKLNFKTELEKHKVELSLVTELMDLGELATSRSLELEKTIDQILGLENKAFNEKKELIQFYSSYKKILGEVEVSYKELGLDWKSTPYKSDSDKLVKKINSVMVEYEKTISKI